VTGIEDAERRRRIAGEVEAIVQIAVKEDLDVAIVGKLRGALEHAVVRPSDRPMVLAIDAELGPDFFSERVETGESIER